MISSVFNIRVTACGYAVLNQANIRLTCTNQTAERAAAGYFITLAP
jgi:hypothetical protein